MRQYFFIIVGIVFLPCFFLVTPSYAEEEITITTYYPSPYGVYNELTTYDNTYLAAEGGTVGIGTTAPDADSKLDVRGSIHMHSVAYEDLALSFGTNNGNEFWSLDWDLSDTADLRLRRYYGGWHDDTLHIQNQDGNIGIGTNAPYGRLCVIGGRAGIGTNMPGSLLHVNGTSEFEDNINTNGNWISGDGGSEGISIDSIGNVGIGTNNPQARLEIVNGSGKIQLVPRTAAGGGSYINLEANFAGGIPGYAQVQAVPQNPSGGRENVSLHFRTPNNGVYDTRMKIMPDGNVGIGLGGWGGSWPSYMLHVNGTAGKPGGGSWSNSSDFRLKDNIQPIEGALDKMLKLRGVTYQWKEPEKHGDMTGTYMSMVAQEVEEVFPEWVGADAEGYKTLGFIGFEALTVEAIRELKAEIESLKQQLNK